MELTMGFHAALALGMVGRRRGATKGECNCQKWYGLPGEWRNGPGGDRGAHRERGLLRGRWELVEMSRQFRFAGPTLEVELDHLEGANAGFPSGPETEEQAGDDRQVD